jgi:aryl-alcohol dehydrogenase-like predicted oxidoreductase
MVELAIAWLLHNQQVSSVIAGASTPEQLDANAKAAELHLTAEEMEKLDGILKDEVSD